MKSTPPYTQIMACRKNKIVDWAIKMIVQYVFNLELKIFRTIVVWCGDKHVLKFFSDFLLTNYSSQ
jgi:hypothetical protein